MFHVSIDKDSKLIKLQINGFIRLDEVTMLSLELQNAFKQFKPNESSIIIKSSDIKPVSPDVIPKLLNLHSTSANHCKKTALIVDNFLALLQIRHMQAVNGFNGEVKVFTSESDANKWILC